MTSAMRKRAMLALLRELAAEIKIAREDLRVASAARDERDRIAGIKGVGEAAGRRIGKLGLVYMRAANGDTKR